MMTMRRNLTGPWYVHHQTNSMNMLMAETRLLLWKVIDVTFVFVNVQKQ